MVLCGYEFSLGGKASVIDDRESWTEESVTIAVAVAIGAESDVVHDHDGDEFGRI